MARTDSPPVNQVTKGAVLFKFACIDPEASAWLFSTAGAPTDGTSGDGATWAGKGSLAVDTTNGKLYINTGTKSSPTWTVVGAQS